MSLAASVPVTPRAISVDHVARAIAEDELTLVFQPQVDAGNGRLIGFEALSRWHSPRFGQVPPDCFIGVAEEGGLADVLWRHILVNVAKGRAVWANPAFASRHVAINLCTGQLQQPGLADMFIAWVSALELDHSQFHIELTESSLMTLTPALRDNLGRLRESGIAVWLDDFGTGYSSLQHLRDLPISGLKIDKSFVRRIEESLNDFRIVSAIVAMANSLGLKVVAEGVETEAQAQILTQLGCNSLQGYLIGKPASLEFMLSHWRLDEGVPPA